MYPASSTGIAQLVPDWAREGGKFDLLLRDAATKEKIKQSMREGLKRRGNEDYSYAVIASYSPNPSLNGLNIVQAAEKLRGSASIDDQIETILQVQAQASGVCHSMSEED